MLSEPEISSRILERDQALQSAVRERIRAGMAEGTSPDALTLALRQLLSGLTATEAAVLKAMAGRIEIASGRPLIVSGGMARLLGADRYGLDLRSAATAEAALKAVDEGQPGTGARALIDLEQDRGWWGRLLARPGLRIVGALPDDAHARPQVLMVSRDTPGPTGDDRSFWITDSPLSDTRIIEALSNTGLAASLLTSAGGLKLFMLAGYVQAEDGRLLNAPGSLTGVVGAAPVI